MTGETSLYPEPAPPGRPAIGWTSSDLVIGTSLIVLLVALFMPWFTGSLVLANVAVTRNLASADATRAHGYMWFVFALAVIGLVVLVARESIRRVPGNLPSPEQLLMVVTGLSLLLTILAVAIKPSPSFDLVSSTGAVPEFLPRFGFTIGWSYGGFVAVAAAAVAFVAAFGAAGTLPSARVGMPGVRRRPSTSAPG
jgi:hypothetical protein